MGWPLDNLGEYNLGRDAIKAAGGSFKEVIKDAKGEAILIAAPFLLLAGGIAALKGKKAIEKNPEKALKIAKKIDKFIDDSF